MPNNILISFYLIVGITLLLEGIIILIFRFYYKDILGTIGEWYTKRELSKLPKDKYLILNNLLLKQDDRLCQIDHVVFSKYGIFVIETKKYNGEIIGDRFDKQWVNKDGVKYTNPITQNYGHVKCIEQLLNLDDTQVFNIVCFTGDIKVKALYEELTDTYTILDRIKSYDDEIISNSQKLYDKIKNLNIKDRILRKEHAQRVKKFKDNSINKCPKCGNELVERKGKNGKFIGCSNFPKCKYTRNI